MIPPAANAAADPHFRMEAKPPMTIRTSFALLLLSLCPLLAAAGCGSSEEGAGDVTAAIDGGPVDEGSGEASPASRRDEPPRVAIETSLGDITVELDPASAPLTVGNFLSYVDDGHYDGTIFHQAIADYVILGGGYTRELKERSVGLSIRNEAHNGQSNQRGTIAMARDGEVIDSGTCQFFINLGDNTSLDHQGRDAARYGYCVFGRVVAGMEVADAIAKVEVRDTDGFEQIPVQPVTIKSIRRVP